MHACPCCLLPDTRDWLCACCVVLCWCGVNTTPQALTPPVSPSTTGRTWWARHWQTCSRCVCVCVGRGGGGRGEQGCWRMLHNNSKQQNPFLVQRESCRVTELRCVQGVRGASQTASMPSLPFALFLPPSNPYASIDNRELWNSSPHHTP